jgi:nucleoside-diphosphate-sugar epimerase
LSRAEAAADVVIGDLRDDRALSRLLVGADAVIHLAGLIKARTRADFFAVNEGGTRSLALAAVGKRIIHVSSLAAREPLLSDYAASKRAGEEAMRDFGGGLVTIVRPPAIYGPGDRETLTLFKAARGPIMIVPGRSQARIAIAEVGDVVRDIVKLLDANLSAGTITIGGDEPQGYRWRDLATAAARAVGGRPIIVGAAPWLLSTAGAASEIVGRWRDTPPIFTSGKAREALHLDWSVSADELGSTALQSYTPLDDGFARTVAWYRANGWLS